MYRIGKHNAANVFNKWFDYASEIEENSCLFIFQSKLKVIRTVTSESFKFLIRKLNKTDCTEFVSNMTTLMRHKLAIWNVIYHSEKGCAFSSNVRLLISLLRRVVVAAIVMKKTHKKSVSALMNLIWKA